MARPLADRFKEAVESAGDDPKKQWAALRHEANKAGIERGEWAGCPIPVDHTHLIMEKRYPFKGLHGAKFSGGKLDTCEVNGRFPRLVNSWFDRRGFTVNIVEEESGERWRFFNGEGVGCRQKLLMDTLGVAANEVWSIEAEEKAVSKLKELISDQAYKCYTLSGMFLETSKRSGVKYLFRKLRPTLAYAPDRNDGADVRLLAVLCLHPLGYYNETFAGVQAPTDDVITHLLMMRACEEKFWGKANHHDPRRPSAGI